MKTRNQIIIAFIIAWFAIFLILIRKNVSNIRKDEGFDSMGISLKSRVKENINTARTMHYKKGFIKVINNKNKSDHNIIGGQSQIKKIENNLSKNDFNQTKMDKYYLKHSNEMVIKEIRSDENKSFKYMALPYLIKNVKNKKMYPDEVKTIKKGHIEIHKITKIDKLKKEEILQEAQTKVQYVGTKNYVVLPNIDIKDINYKKKFKKSNLVALEKTIPPKPKDYKVKKNKPNYKLIFDGYEPNQELTKLHKKDNVYVKTKWLNMVQVEKRLKKQAQFNKYKKDTIEVIFALKELKDEEKNQFVSLVHAKINKKEIKKVLILAKQKNTQNANNNGIGTLNFGLPVWSSKETGTISWHLANEGVFAVDFQPPGSYSGRDPIIASDNGIIAQASWMGPYGKCVIINHRNGYFTRYAHMSSLSVVPGQVVHKGEQLGLIGTTGNSTGVHVHFEIMSGSKTHTINPTQFGIGY